MNNTRPRLLCKDSFLLCAAHLFTVLQTTLYSGFKFMSVLLQLKVLLGCTVQGINQGLQQVLHHEISIFDPSYCRSVLYLNKGVLMGDYTSQESNRGTVCGARKPHPVCRLCYGLAVGHGTSLSFLKDIPLPGKVSHSHCIKVMLGLDNPQMQMLYELENAGHVYGVLMWDGVRQYSNGILVWKSGNMCLMHSKQSAHVCSMEAKPWLDERGQGTRFYYTAALREVQSNYSTFFLLDP